jgi:hypothetical protein
LEDALYHERATDVGHGRTNERHDPNLVQTGEKRQANDVRHCQTGSHNQHGGQENTQTTRQHNDGQDTFDPLTVVPNIGDSSHLTDLRGQLADAIGIGSGSQPDFDRSRQGVPLETPGRDGQGRKVAFDTL